MNIKNVRKLLSHLKKQQKTEQAARFNMRYFGASCTDGLNDILQQPVCNTQACLAGETVLALHAGYIKPNGGINIYKKSPYRLYDIEDVAVKLLDLTDDERERLFFFRSMTGGANGWPKRFEDKYRNATTPVERLAVAISRVEHFIKTKGRQ